MLVQDADARDATDEQIEATVRALPVSFDDAGPANVEHGRAAFVVRLESGPKARDGKRLVADERIADELAIARLEHVKWESRTGKERDVRERKDRKRSEVFWIETQAAMVPLVRVLAIARNPD
jgi:hypothetical protein